MHMSDSGLPMFMFRPYGGPGGRVGTYNVGLDTATESWKQPVQIFEFHMINVSRYEFRSPQKATIAAYDSIKRATLRVMVDGMTFVLATTGKVLKWLPKQSVDSRILKDQSRRNEGSYMVHATCVVIGRVGVPVRLSRCPEYSYSYTCSTM
jgi:hypothetical protein